MHRRWNKGTHVAQPSAMQSAMKQWNKAHIPQPLAMQMEMQVDGGGGQGKTRQNEGSEKGGNYSID